MPDYQRSSSGVLSPFQFGVLCILGYVTLSWAFRYDMRLGTQIASAVYPLDTFSMYAGVPGGDRSLLMVRSADGQVHRVTEFTDFDCAEPITGSSARCKDQRGIEYRFADLARHVQDHPGQGDSEIELITRTWEIEPGVPVTTSDCVVTPCRASRR